MNTPDQQSSYGSNASTNLSSVCTSREGQAENSLLSPKPRLRLGPIAQRDPLKLLFICPVIPPFSPPPVPRVYDFAPFGPTSYPYSSASRPQGPTTPQLRSESLAGLCHPAAALPAPGSLSKRVASIQFMNSAPVSAFWCHLKTIGSLRTLQTMQPLQPSCNPLCSAICGFGYMCAQRDINKVWCVMCDLRANISHSD